MSAAHPDVHPPPALHVVRDDPASRKAFLRLVGTGGGAALATLLAACGDSGPGSAPTTSAGARESTATNPTIGTNSQDDLAILNFALTLEYLEADFYAKIVDSGEIKDRRFLELAKVFGETERAHVDKLRTTAALYGTPSPRPKTTFDDVFARGEQAVLGTLATVENVGASAYLGQAPRIQLEELLAAALSIHTVEARHAAALNRLAGRGFSGGGAGKGSIPDGAFARPMTMDAVRAAVKPFLA